MTGLHHMFYTNRHRPLDEEEMMNVTERNVTFSSGLNDGRAYQDVRTVSICDTQPCRGQVKSS